ncbi:MAG: pilus assembly protein [Kiritimatiellae bacterium]|nr:pilus assembly protein [Kiritimatiellia bacterium]
MKRGSIMLESALVLPIFVLLIFFLIQMTFVWVAKQMTYYAAYCGARAALVYNPADYAEKDDGGVVKMAACSALSWVAWGLNGTDALNYRLGTGFAEDEKVPFSSKIYRQVDVKISEYVTITNGKSQAKSPKEIPIDEQFPAVTVEVSFECPLFIPFGGALIAYFFSADEMRLDTSNDMRMNGFLAEHGDIVHSKLQTQGRYYEVNEGLGVYSIPISERCTLAKPYKTVTFPVMSSDEKDVLRGMFGL